MDSIERREFIKRSLMGLGAIGLSQFIGSCAPETAAVNNAGISGNGEAGAAEGSAVMPTNVPTAINTVSNDSFSGAQLSVARGGDDPEVLARRAVAAVGGMERFIPKGAAVVVKPNICVPRSYELGATTNPFVVGALVKMAFEAGAGSVKVLDFPFGGPSDVCYENSGIAEQVHLAGGEMEVIADFKFIQTAIPGAQRLTEAAIYDDILNADVLINAPVAKNHMMAGYTMGMKNLMGVIENRGVLHRSFEECLPDLNSKIPSTLTVIDAVRIMRRNGPTGGSPDDIEKIDTVIASADIVAADSYGATLFGVTAADIGYIRNAAERGLGSMDLSSMKIEEINV